MPRSGATLEDLDNAIKQASGMTISDQWMGVISHNYSYDIFIKRDFKSIEVADKYFLITWTINNTANNS
jgi:hypothetical protein